jgi:hypothetical protein
MLRKAKSAVAILLLVTCCLPLAGCTLFVKPPSKPSLWEKKADVANQIKLGMDAQAAKDAMEALGFRCEWKRDGTLRYYAKPSDITMAAIENVDFIACRMNQSDGFIEESFTVSLLLKGTTVEKIYYVRELTGV